MRFRGWRQKAHNLLRLRARIEDQRQLWEAENYDERHYLTRGLLAQVEVVTWKVLRPYIRNDADVEFYERSKAFIDEQDAKEKQRSLALQQALTEAQLSLKVNDVETKLSFPGRRQEALTLALEAMGQNREHLPNKILGSVQRTLGKFVDPVYPCPKICSLAGHRDPICTVALSADGQTIISGSYDNTVRVWSVEGTLLRTLEGHTGDVNAVALSADVQTIVSGSEDRTVRVWEQSGWRSWLRSSLQQLRNNWTYDQEGWVARAYLFEKGYSLAEADDSLAGVEAALKQLQLAYQCGRTGGSSSADKPEKLSPDQAQTDAKGLLAPLLWQQGERYARSANYSEAVDRFRRAKEFGPELKELKELDPDVEASKLTAIALKRQGVLDALQLKVEEATAKFTQAKQYAPALELEPEAEAKRIAVPVLVEQGKALLKQEQVRLEDVQAALDAYQTAQTYDAALEISADNWNSLLWYGSLHAATAPKLVKALLTASQKALGADANNTSLRDTLGVAKVLAGGKRNWNSAIQDFEFYIANSNQPDKEQRQRWIAALKAGQNPLTADEIKTLFSQ